MNGTDIIILIFIILFVIIILVVPILFADEVEYYKVSTDLSSEVYICKDYNIDRNNFSIYLSMNSKNPFFGFDDSDVVVVKYSEFYQIEEVRSSSLFERWFCE